MLPCAVQAPPSPSTADYLVRAAVATLEAEVGERPRVVAASITLLNQLMAGAADSAGVRRIGEAAVAVVVTRLKECVQDPLVQVCMWEHLWHSVFTSGTPRRLAHRLNCAQCARCYSMPACTESQPHKGVR